MFVNYFDDASRQSAVNTAVARVVLGGYVIWKVLAYDWGAYQEWPVFPLFNDRYAFLAPDVVLNYLRMEAWLAIVALVLFVVGYRTTLAAFVSAVAVTHLGTVVYMLNFSFQSQSFFLPAILLLLYALYVEQDRLSVDGFRHTATRSLSELNEYLQSAGTPSRRSDWLKWALVILAVAYFVGGVGKILVGPLGDWATVENMNRFTLYENVEQHQSRPVAEFLRAHPLLGLASAWGTIVLETGFLLAVLAGTSVTPFVLGLGGMHAFIALSMNPFFFDQYVLYALFVPWDRVLARLARSEPVVLVYDERCYFCARTLTVVKELDVNRSVRFHTQSTVPDEYASRPDVSFEEEMYVFRDGEAYGGYDAFRELLRQNRVFAPLVWLLGTRPVAFVGHRVYRYVAANRDRHFVCSVDIVESEE